ncbi:FeoC-like transcriptional regulator [Thauera linaloolentis]|uniref:Sugar metabolism transcriptional regulator n=1 Tax=Thauera linaloolentis (strain DSM 12138 / JCM 21573 / CCUG 41526 / CIP 105981 / IAM 15112 / NBRC 102519 / 47Lol) TaxID=1123367 RepID=N6Z1Z0_THAL4|nr:FeoC-like transcriptional regulator [Thauera linaloolentis]ENO88632.1 sugar metabolism transcriptional regulator [Thauera linaloolentis 47Lol = DSM 12138]MCM8565677.1 FeoC-like transcriptional regulator [Thauera linaloolentis]
MILSRLSAYLRERRRASVADMAHALESTPEALGPMLGTLERKGRVRRIVGAASGCGTTCCKCDPETLVVYEWAGSEAAAGAAEGLAGRPPA